MEPRPFLEHIRIPLSHPRDLRLTQLLHKHIPEDRPCAAQYITPLDGVVDVRDNTQGTVCERDAKEGGRFA